MPKFIVKNTPILHNGKRYDIGAEIELTDEQAENNAINLTAVTEEKQKISEIPPTEPTEEKSAVTEDDVQMAEANIAESEKAKKGKK